MSVNKKSSFVNSLGLDPSIGNRMGFIETVDDTLILYRAALKSEVAAEASFEETLIMRNIIEHLKRSDLYHLDTQFDDMLFDYSQQYEGLNTSEVRFSEFTRPPSRKCYIRLNSLEKYLNHETDIVNVGFITEYFEDKVTKVTMCAPFASPFLVGAYHPQKGIIEATSNGRTGIDISDAIEFNMNVLIMVAGAFELINNPRFTVSEKAGTRAQRKQMKREQDIALEAWHKISWNVDEDIVEIGDGDRGGWHMPLHYTRGHPRKAEPHWDDVMYKDGKPYIWIHGFWSGHPAYGIKRGYHAPKLKAS